MRTRAKIRQNDFDYPKDTSTIHRPNRTLTNLLYFRNDPDVTYQSIRFYFMTFINLEHVWDQRHHPQKTRIFKNPIKINS